jgi:two-component system, NarL family, response regulator YdfI
VTRILIGASSRVVRLSLETVIATDAALKLLGSFSLRDALERLEDLAPEIAVLDVASATDEALIFSSASEAPRAPGLVVLTDEPASLSAVEALRAGIRALLPRRAAAEEILAAVRASATGLIVFHPEALDAAFSPLVPGEAAESEASDQLLTAREIEVLRMIADGSSNKQIAVRLGISEHTVKFHIASIFAKLGAASRTEAVTIGIRKGLVML